ncbi:hypothetical protein U1Q18_005960, partial [Sarracenia purpurea var. burkii]
MGKHSRSKGCCKCCLGFLVAAIIAIAMVILINKKKQHSESELGPVPGPPGAVQKEY